MEILRRRAPSARARASAYATAADRHMHAMMGHEIVCRPFRLSVREFSLSTTTRHNSRPQHAYTHDTSTVGSRREYPGKRDRPPHAKQLLKKEN